MNDYSTVYVVLLQMDEFLMQEHQLHGTNYQILNNEDLYRAKERARKKRHYERQKWKCHTDQDYKEEIRKKWRERKARQRRKSDTLIGGLS